MKRRLPYFFFILVNFLCAEIYGTTSIVWVGNKLSNRSENISKTGAEENRFTDKSGVSFENTRKITTYQQSSAIDLLLINAITDSEIGVLENGQIIDAAELPTVDLNIKANILSSEVNSVVFSLSGPIMKSRGDNTLPYTLIPTSGDDFLPQRFAVGDYELSVIAYSGPSQNGSIVESITYSFSIVNGQNSCWENLTSSNVGRVEAQSAKVGDNFYILAGFLANVFIAGETEIYHVPTDTWSMGAPMPFPANHTAVAVVGTDIWVLGGFVGNHPGTATSMVQIYDTLNDSWSLGPALPNARASAAAAVNGDKIHFFGGLLPDRMTDVGEHYILDINNIANGWVAGAALPNPRNHLGGASVDGIVYAIGGNYNHDNVFPEDTPLLHAYDPSTDVWTRMADLPNPRSHAEAAIDVYNGKIIVAGGKKWPSPFYETVIQYDPAINQWTQLCALPEKLLATNAKVFGNKLIVSGGGLSTNTFPTSGTRSLTLEGATNNQPPVAVATADTTSGTAPLVVNFTGDGSTDDNGVTGYLWDFGDGTTSSIANPRHTFSDPGSYIVELTVTDASGLNDITSLTINVEEPAQDPGTVFFLVDADSDSAILTISDGMQIDVASLPTDNLGILSDPESESTFSVSMALSGTSSYSTTENYAPYSLFGDRPGNDYLGSQLQPGSYTITATAYSGYGLSGSLVETGSVSFELVGGNSNQPPVAVATANILSGTAPLAVSFAGDGSTDDNGVTGYLWDFGDGTTSSIANPRHTFSDPGSYIVELTVTDASGLNDITSLAINAEEPPQNSGTVFTLVDADGDSAILTISDGMQIDVASLPTDNLGILADPESESAFSVSMALSGTSSYSTTENYAPYSLFGDRPGNDYLGSQLQPGSYTITATAYSGYGLSGSLVETGSVSFELVGGTNNQPPVAVATADTTSGTAPLVVNFTGDGSTDDNGVTGYLWDFEDGATSTIANPVHTFSTPGTYQVELIVTDASGSSGTLTIEITVESPQSSDAIFHFANADTDTVIMPITDGLQIDISSLATDNLAILFEPESSTSVRSVGMILLGTVEQTATENYAPYSIFGDRPGGDLLGSDLPPGNYTLTAVTYSGYGLSGNIMETVSISFELVENVAVNLSTKIANGMQLFPNPARNATTAGFEEEIELKNVMIFDTNGRMIKTYPTKRFKNNKNYALNFETLFPGIYIIKAIDSEGKVFQEKLIVPE